MNYPMSGNKHASQLLGWLGLIALFVASCAGPSAPDDETSDTESPSSIPIMKADSSSDAEPETPLKNRANAVEWSNDYLGVIFYTDSAWARMDAAQESALKSNFLNQPEWASLFQLIAVYENRENSEFIALSEYTGTERWYADVEQRMFSLGSLYLDSDEDLSENSRIYRMHLKIPGFHWVRIIDERTGQRILQVDYFENVSDSDPSWDWKSKASKLQTQFEPLGYY